MRRRSSCDLVLPDHHALESWGDATPLRGSATLQQPGMDPVFDSRRRPMCCSTLAKADPSLAAKYPWPDYRTLLISRFPGGSTAFTSALTTAVVQNRRPRRAPPRRRAREQRRAAGGRRRGRRAATLDQSHGDFYLVVYPSPALGDGRGANKPWLQELPDPVTKTVWQTVVEMHPETARRLGLEAGDHVRVETDNGFLVAPVFVYLGVRVDIVAIAHGRGHTAYGRYAKGVGLNR